ncbi:MAG: MltA domain-containing protein [Rubellimicrobium sp.]|nr:MltA domain-containing protein [Rubellimicrobium sp.]
MTQIPPLPDAALSGAGAALSAYLRTRPADWPQPAPGEDAAAFLSAAFRPHRPKDDGTPLFTGYFEPEIDASPDPVGRFRHPLYRLPPDPGHDHAAILAGALAGRGLEIAWLADPVERFFLQVQGSGRLRLTDGRVLRLGYAGQNGHPYRSLGREMVARGLIPQDRIGADTMRAWFRDNPDRVTELLILNPSWVYFRELTGLGPDDGPIGTAGVPLVPMVSLAVDPAHVPLGAPVLLNTTVDGAPFLRLMVAQDTGGAIRGAQRGDIYFGTGARAGLRAGRQNAPGCLTVLLPRDM